MALGAAFVLGLLGGAAWAGLLSPKLVPLAWRMPVGGFLAGVGIGIAILVLRS